MPRFMQNIKHIMWPEYRAFKVRIRWCVHSTVFLAMTVRKDARYCLEFVRERFWGSSINIKYIFRLKCYITCRLPK